MIISNEMMDLLEEWSEPTGSLTTLALDSRPELIEGYAAFAEDHYDGRPLAELFAERLPLAWAEIVATLGGGDPDAEPAAADILAFAMAGGNEEYAGWQLELAEAGADFESFVAGSYPEAMSQAAALEDSPARLGIGLLDFAEAKGTGAGDFATLMEYVQDHEFFPIRDCACWTAVTFPDRPIPYWKTEKDESDSDSWGKLPKKSWEYRYKVVSWGSARDIDFSRRSEHNTQTFESDHRNNTAGMRVRMTCTRNFEPYGICPYANACQGQLTTRIAYASRVFENVSVGGIRRRDSHALTADLVKLVYSVDGGPLSTFFIKGGAVAGDFHADWDSFPVANQLYSNQVPARLENAYSPAGNTLAAQLEDPYQAGFAGILTRSSGAGGLARNMKATWENPAFIPFILLPDQTHLFELQTRSKVYGHGYGGQSESSNNLDSATALTAVGHHYQCTSQASGPPARAFWSYVRAPDAPYSLFELQNLVGTFANQRLGASVPNLGTARGQYP